jgi:hypothetical protein
MKTLTTPAFVLLSFAIVLILPLAAIPQTAVPMLINYQGELRSPSTGQPVPDGAYNMLFRICDVESEGAPLWEGTHTDMNGNPVQVTNGILSVILGSGAGNELSSSIFSGADRWLEITVGAETLSPRQRITSVSYSLVSENSRFLGGNQVSDFVIQADGLRLQPNAISPNLIGGHQNNAVTDGVAGATVGGGGTRFSSNRVTDDLGTVGGGEDNQAGDNAGTTGDARCATVGGGWSNTASANYTSVGGGQSNTAGDSYATVAGGYSNDASGSSATVGGGYSNTASGSRATVAGGYSNDASGSSATVGGGYSNTAGDSYATVAGGYNNAASGSSAAVAGGYSNVASGDYATVAGGWSNQATASYATIAGGGPSDPDNPSTTRNLVTDEYGTIGGGGDNQAGDNAGTAGDARYGTVGGGRANAASKHGATVGGGVENTASSDYATVGGGYSNEASASYATIAGGGRSDLQDPNTGNLVTDDYGTIGGGGHNQAGDNAGTTGDRTFATVGGGNGNIASDSYATVAGGMNNAASGYQSTVSGGYSNEANGDGSTVCGGRDNTASGLRATAAAGYKNTAAGDYSFAAGRRAQAIHAGAFVWGDSQDADVVSTANNQITFRCGGGVRFRSGNLGANQDLSWAPGNASWTFSSDRSLKENFVEIDPKEVLDRVSRLPVTEWNFKGYSQRHVGPVAQDFHALFPLGGTETMIDSGDLHGISLAAIQGLHELLREKDAKISTLEARIAALESLVEKLVESQAGGK